MPNGRIHWQGLDYAAAQAGLALSGITIDPSTWLEIRVLEAAALEELNRHEC